MIGPRGRQFTATKIRGGHNHEQHGNAERREDIKQRCLFEIDQEKNQQRQAKYPEVSEAAALLCFSSYSLTHETCFRPAIKRKRELENDSSLQNQTGGALEQGPQHITHALTT